MKTKLLIFGMLIFNLSFGQNNSNGPVSTNLANSNLINSTLPLPQSAEIFRFRPGLVTQLDDPANLNFGFTNSRWFSIGSLNTGSQTIYGLRFQLPNKAVTFGYQNVNDTNPGIQWIGSGAALGNLEFRVADSFTSTNSNLVATMTPNGRTIFGDATNIIAISDSTKVFIENNRDFGLTVRSLERGSRNSVGLNVLTQGGFERNLGGRIVTNGARFNTGLFVSTNDMENATGAIGIQAFASANLVSTAVLGKVQGEGFFDVGIYGDVENNKGSAYAGYFNGDVTVTGTFNNPSDRKLKENLTVEKDALQKIMQLQPQTYTFKKFSEINLGKGLQHGFISQDLAKVYPELTTDIKKPILDNDGNQSSVFEYKSVNYNGLISILTAGIQELNTELQLLKEEIAALKNSKSERKSFDTATPNTKGAFLQQNIPNPFGDQTTITYQLPEGTTAAEIMVFDLTGKLIKTYAVDKNQSELTIKASDIGNGLFIYSLVQDGQELLSKKMVVKS